MTKLLKTTAIEAANSLDFLQKVFRLYDTGTLFTVARSGLDLELYPALEVTETFRAKSGGGWGQFSFATDDSDVPIQILFSSGTEGVPKPIVLSRRNISDVVKRLNTAMEPDDTIREYIGVPVTYSFGLGRVRAVSAAGGRFFLPERFDPVQIRDMLERSEINAISAVPTLWRVVLAAPQSIGEAGGAVRWIEIGSQYMSAKEKIALRSIFPNARIVQHYGLTEASRTTFLDISRTEDALLESVGTTTPPAQIRIGNGGEICIRGDHVALGVLDDTGIVRPLMDADGWLHTKDRGEIRDGHLYFLGRLDDQMNIAGVNVSAENLERGIVDLCGCSGQIAVSSSTDLLRGDVALVAIEQTIADRRPLIEKAAEIVLAKSGVNQSGSVKTIVLDQIPVTDTGKVRRKEIRRLHESSSPDHLVEVESVSADILDLTPEEAEIRDAWRKVVGQVAVRPDETFYDIGGDSLSAVQIGIVMEGAFDRAVVRATLEGRSLRDVANSQREAQNGNADTGAVPVGLPDRTTSTWSINITRALMALAVLMSHWGPGLFQRLAIGQQADYFLGGVYRMGTEGFATIFGIGLGFFFLPRYATDKISVHKRLRLSFLLVLSGLTLMAAVRILRLVLQGAEVGGLEISQAFYNILAYYVLAFATAPVWLWYLTRGTRGAIVRALIVVMLAAPVTWAFRATLPGQLDSLLEWPRLMAVAGYSYFQLSALVFAGIAVGFWYSRQRNLAEASMTLAFSGAFGMAITMTVGVDVLPPNSLVTSASPFFQSLLGYVFYFSLVVFLVGIFDLTLKRWNSLNRLVRGVLQILIVIGGLALPIYAFHGVVIPLKDIFSIFGLPGVAALAIPMGGFLAIMLYLGWRLRRMYFG